MRVLTLADWYLPGSNGGGMPRSIVNLADRLAGELEFHVITRDHDVGESQPYPGIRAGEWTPMGSARVLYLSGGPSTAVLRRAIEESRADVLYLNSVFSWPYSIRPMLAWRAGAVPRLPVIVAPCGELHEGAMRVRGPRKRAFLAAVRAAGLHRGVTWRASTELEAEDVRRWFGPRARVRIARDLPPAPAEAEVTAPRVAKEAGVLRAVFLSRISPKKNLLGALEILGGVSGQVRLDVYGPLEDAAYWEACQRRAESLPSNVTLRYRGALSHDEVGAAFREQDLFFFPTLGENYGHVVQEALLAGCPVLMSDTTPWRLAGPGVGWDLPLDDVAGFRAVLEQCVRMGPEEHAALSARARRMGVDVAQDTRTLAANRALFVEAAGVQSAAASGSPVRRAG